MKTPANVRIKHCKNLIFAASRKVGNIAILANQLPWLEMTTEFISLLEITCSKGYSLTANLTLTISGKWCVYYFPAYIDSLSDENLVHLILHETAHLFLGHPWRLEINPEDTVSSLRRNIAADRFVNSWTKDIISKAFGYTDYLDGFYLKNHQDLSTYSLEMIYNEEVTPDTTEVDLPAFISQINLPPKLLSKIAEQAFDLTMLQVESSSGNLGPSKNSSLLNVSIHDIEPILIPLYPYDELEGDDWDYIYSYERLNRHHETLPGRVRKPSSGSICLILDTSGSIKPDMYKIYTAIAMGFESKGIDLKVVLCDSQVIETYPDYTSFLNGEYKGGGSTDMNKAIVKANTYDVSRILLLSDGDYSAIKQRSTLPLDILVIKQGPSLNQSKVPCNYYYL